MTVKTIEQILKAHGIPYFKRGGEIFADSMIGGTALFEIVENVTTWNRARLLSWLGY